MILFDGSSASDEVQIMLDELCGSENDFMRDNIESKLINKLDIFEGNILPFTKLYDCMVKSMPFSYDDLISSSVSIGKNESNDSFTVLGKRDRSINHRKFSSVYSFSSLEYSSFFSTLINWKLIHPFGKVQLHPQIEFSSDDLIILKIISDSQEVEVPEDYIASIYISESLLKRSNLFDSVLFESCTSLLSNNYICVGRIIYSIYYI